MSRSRLFLTQSPVWQLFLLSLLIYVPVIWWGQTEGMIWDEDRYLESVQRWLEGHFTLPEKPEIIHGPGYPALLLPLVAMGVPLEGLRLVNALLMAGAVVLSFLAGRSWVSERCGWVLALVTMLHPSFLRVAPFMMTEPLTLLFLSGFVWLFHGWMQPGKARWTSLLGGTLMLTGVMLTRVIFGQVVEVLLLLLIPAWMAWKSQRPQILRVALMLGLALMLCIPYLVHTSRMTGKMHCWSTYGSELLYWSASAPDGDWFLVGDAIADPELAPEHAAFLQSLETLNVSERARAYGEKAREKITQQPVRYALNCLHNASRLAFGYPRAQREQQLGSVVLFIVNVPLLLLQVAALLLALRHWREVTVEWLVLLLFAAIYLSASVLLPALARYGIILWPVLGVLSARVLSRHVRVSLS